MFPIRPISTMTIKQAGFYEISLQANDPGQIHERPALSTFSAHDEPRDASYGYPVSADATARHYADYPYVREHLDLWAHPGVCDFEWQTETPAH